MWTANSETRALCKLYDGRARRLLSKLQRRCFVCTRSHPDLWWIIDDQQGQALLLVLPCGACTARICSHNIIATHDGAGQRTKRLRCRLVALQSGLSARVRASLQCWILHWFSCSELTLPSFQFLLCSVFGFSSSCARVNAPNWLWLWVLINCLGGLVVSSLEHCCVFQME